MVTFRAINEADIPTIGTWILAQPDHAERFDSRWYTEALCSFVIEDEQGAVIFVRQDAEANDTLRLHTEFLPAFEGSQNKARIAIALAEAYPLVARDALRRGFKQIVFESGSMSLIEFMLRFGFRAELRHQLSVS
jgi:hypothetical protein